MRENIQHLIVERKISLDDLIPRYSDKELIITDMSSIFRKEPQQWALRGEPHLWIEMCNNFKEVAIPTQKSDFEELIYNEFKKITGNSIFSVEKHIYVSHLAHGGMSSGWVVPKYWLKKAIPCLWARVTREPFNWPDEIY